MYDNPNKFAQNPQRRAPNQWKVDNLLYQIVLANAQKTGHEPLIQRVEQMKTGTRHDLAVVANPIARAAKGRIDATTIDIDAMLKQGEIKV